MGNPHFVGTCRLWEDTIEEKGPRLKEKGKRRTIEEGRWKREGINTGNR